MEQLIDLTNQMSDLVQLATQHLINDSSFRSYLIDLEDSRLKQERLDIFDRGIARLTSNTEGGSIGQSNESNQEYIAGKVERKISFS